MKKVLKDVYKRQPQVLWDGSFLAFGVTAAEWVVLAVAVAAWLAADALNERGVAPVSYTHLDVYKRQDLLWRR